MYFEPQNENLEYQIFFRKIILELIKEVNITLNRIKIKIVSWQIRVITELCRKSPCVVDRFILNIILNLSIDIINLQKIKETPSIISC